MTKGEWIDVIKNTMAKVDEQGIYRRPLIERHIQSVYEQMFNELYRENKSSIWHYVREYTLHSVSDWYLPSQDALDKMYDNLHAEGVGGFADSIYWSSSEYSASRAHGRDFTLGTAADYTKSDAHIIRPARHFVADYGDYAVRDTGPSGGLVYYIEEVSGTYFYHEAALDDVTPRSWSNVDSTALLSTGTDIGDGLANTAAIIAQDGHTSSAAQFAQDYFVVGDVTSLSNGTAMQVLPVSFHRKGGGVFRTQSSNHSVMVTDMQGYKAYVGSLFDTAGIMGQYFCYVSGDKLYSNIPLDYGETFTYGVVPKFTALSSADEVLIPGGNEDHFIDRIIDTIKHFRPTDLINDNTIQ